MHAGQYEQHRGPYVPRLTSFEPVDRRWPGVLLDPNDTLPLIKAWAGVTGTKVKKDGETDDTPEKNEASHVADSASTCACTPKPLQGGSSKPRARKIEVASAAGWT